MGLYQVIVRLRGCVNSFKNNNDGNFAILFAVGASLLVFGVGVAIDFSKVTADKAKAQDIADAGILAAATAIFNDGVSESEAKKRTKILVQSMSDGVSYLKCADVVKKSESVSISCNGGIATTFGKLAGKNKLEYTVYSEAIIAEKPKVEISLVYDISDSMLVDGKLPALENALGRFFRSSIFTDTEFETAYSLIPFANSVAFESPYERWVDPVNGYSISPTFNRCFTPEATVPNIPFDGDDVLIATPERLSNKDRTYCPVSQMTAQFFSRSPLEATRKISGIVTSNGTGSNEALMWGYRSLHPSHSDDFSSSVGFPRSFDNNHKKILIFLTDGKPKNKPWIGKAKDNPKNNEESEQRFRDACNFVRSQKDNIDVYMIGFGKVQRGTDLKPLLENCVKGDGYMALADNRTLEETLKGIVSLNTEIAITH